MNGFEDLRWDSNGLIPALVQDANNLQVLMVAYMNREALTLTLQTGNVHFWSRSRQELWRKGATSGNVMVLSELWYDCDGDAILVQVWPQGPACHTGEVSCFFRQLSLRDFEDGPVGGRGVGEPVWEIGWPAQAAEGDA
ncbi:MAG: phosphoribosyl-AMP cyclohydrolase [Chloroflexota bacterium]|nr:phosphoribosyl-AMP cyclohydrolase [Chloroflexota bacterium]